MVISRNTRKRLRKAGRKYLKCIQCGFKWNVSIESQETDATYICPVCRGKNKKEQ